MQIRKLCGCVVTNGVIDPCQAHGKNNYPVHLDTTIAEEPKPEEPKPEELCKRVKKKRKRRRNLSNEVTLDKVNLQKDCGDEISQIILRLKKNKVRPIDMNEPVHNTAHHVAAKINNEGYVSQVNYLLSNGWKKEDIFEFFSETYSP